MLQLFLHTSILVNRHHVVRTVNVARLTNKLFARVYLHLLDPHRDVALSVF